ncbi:MAG TPA: heme o synthase [Roseiflexaceae bacterium]|nr:heme o synthase [Roseiflexaceae bacterium]
MRSLKVSGTLLALARSRPRVLGIAGLAYALALLSLSVGPLAGAALSAVAMAALGGALYLHTAARTPIAGAPRLGGRTQAARRRYERLALASVAALYLALVGGALVTEGGALWACTSWPLCTPRDELAWLALAHRGLAGLATLLVVALGALTWRRRPDPALRRAFAWAVGLLLLQNGIGFVQVLAAQSSDGLPTDMARLAHLAVGMVAWGALVVAATLGVRLPWPIADSSLKIEDSLLTFGAANMRSSILNLQAPTSSQGASDTILLSGRPSLLKDYISLTKPGVISLLILTTITAMYITPAGAPDLGLVLWTALGGWLMASGSHALNCYFDRDIDVNMGRTSRRPIPSGRIPAWHAAALGTALGTLAFAQLWLTVNLAAALLALAGLVYYVFVYTLWLKRTSPNNIVIGGGAGAFPPLVGWAAVTGGVTPAALLLWLIIFYWTPPHFWALALIRQKDYARAGVPMLPVVAGDGETRKQIVLYSIQMLALTVLPTPFGMLGLPYLAMALALGALFLYYALRLWRQGTTASAWGLYKYSLLYLALLFVAMVVDRALHT